MISRVGELSIVINKCFMALFFLSRGVDYESKTIG